MSKQDKKPMSRKAKVIGLGSIAAGVTLVGSLAFSGVTPTPDETVLAKSTTATQQPSDGAVELDDAETAVDGDKRDAAAADAAAAELQASNINAAPAKPKANDEELGRTPQKKNKAVKMNDKVQVLDGLTVGISNLAAVAGVADEPGEVAGDAVKVSVTFTNTSSAPADTSGVVVDLEAGPNAAPGMALQGSGTTTFPATIAPGASATADYVFVVDSNQRARVSVLVNYSVTAPIAVFEGTAPPAKGKQ